MAAACGGDGFLWYKKVESVTVSPAESGISAGSTRQFAATALYNDHRKADVSNDCAWTSSDPAIAVIDAAGLATGISTGAITITAVFDGKSGSASLTVTGAAGTRAT